ncbi:MAG: fibronectin type III domain-containing protein, partial [Bacteroidetes bacterium]|nr:fibronectin type III domain-containing protein [Bacteroidota bacterium]
LKVENLSVTLGDTSGEASLHWDPIAKVKGYKIQMMEEATAPSPVPVPIPIPVPVPAPSDANWKSATPDVSTKSKMTATGLTPGKQTWFRVAAFNSAGTGAWSNPVGRIIS